MVFVDIVPSMSFPRNRLSDKLKLGAVSPPWLTAKYSYPNVYAVGYGDPTAHLLYSQTHWQAGIQICHCYYVLRNLSSLLDRFIQFLSFSLSYFLTF